MIKKPFIYLSSPYTHPNRYVEQARAYEMVRIMGKLLTEQDFIIPYSPIAHTFYIEPQVKKPDFDWYEWDEQYLIRFDGMKVIKQDGWEDSEGVLREIEFCKKYKLPYIYSNPDEVVQDAEAIAWHVNMNKLANGENRFERIIP